MQSASMCVPVCAHAPLREHSVVKAFPARIEGAAKEEVIKISRVDPVLWPSNGFTGPLSQDQLRSFDEEGFLILPEGFFPLQLVKECSEAMQALANQDHQSPQEVEEGFHNRRVKVINEAGVNAVRSLFRIDQELTNPLARLVRSEKSITTAQQILQDEVYIHQCRVNFQSAFDGCGFFWHSDFESWYAEDGMPRMRAMSLVAFLANNSAQNGALMIIPRSHKLFIATYGRQGSKHWETSLQNQSYGIVPRQALRELVEQEGIVYAEGKPGQGVIFDCNLIHGSHSNISPHSRINVFSVFNAVSNSLQTPFYANKPRAEYVATRDPAWVKPATPMWTV